MAQLIAWSEITLGALQNLWLQVLGILPLILGALVVLVVGLIVASVLKLIVSKVTRLIKLDSLLIHSGMEKYFQRGGLKIDTGEFFGQLVYWFVIVAFVLAASDILKFYAFSNFLTSVLVYIPTIIVAILIMLAALVVANFLRILIKASVASARLQGGSFLGNLAWWAVVIFGLLAALMQLGIATSALNIILSGLMAMIAIAGGIAFGIGGKDYASHLILRIREELEIRR